jgi:uncharacterized protein
MSSAAPTDVRDGGVRARRPAIRRRRRALLTTAVIVAVLIVAAIVLSVYVDWLWFGEVGLRTVFWTRLAIGVVAGLGFGAAFFAIFFANILIAARLAPRYSPVEGIDVVEVVHGTAQRWVRRVGVALGMLGGLIAGASAAGAWLVFARALYGVPFGTADPVFHHDLGFYVFTLPAWHWVYAFLFATLVVTLLAALVAHLVLGGISQRDEYLPDGRPAPSPRSPAAWVVRFVRTFPLDVSDGALSHLSALLAALFVLGGLGYVLDAWGLLYSTGGAVFGAGYTDVTIRLPLIRVLMVLAFALGAALVYNAVKGRRRLWLPLAVGVWLAAVIVLLGIVPAIWQALFVNPNELAKETPYIARNIAATRAAYGLTAVSTTPYSLRGDLSAAKLRVNSVTVRNIRLWDPDVLRRSYSQLQELRPYYAFTTVSVDRYQVNGVYTQTMLAPRELQVEGLPPQARTWVNEHITYTHGYGVTLSAVNQVASGGTPDFLVQDIPVVSSAPALTVRQPRIYYGLLGTDFLLVKTKGPEFDYPGPGGDVYTTYAGTGGIPISPVLNRVAFAVRFADIRFLTTTAITARSRVIIYDDIRARLAAAAPFLAFDADPYMVIADGGLYWIADAYTTTDRVPYSQPGGHLNYLRNAVKVVVDAYDGSMTFYVFDPADPLLRTYARIFPGMFKPAAAMPTALRSHVRYPQDLFRIQAQLFATYHVTDVSLWYNKGDQWEIPGNVSISGSGPMSALYMVMRLPGETHEEFILLLPFVPNGRPNMIAWLGAQSDAPYYGKAVSFRFPSSQNVYGPAQVEAAINQDPTISAQRTLWGQQGSEVIFGNLLTVPIGDSMLYVQPLYLQSLTTHLPQIQRVIVFYRSPSATPRLPTGQQQNVVMAPTLDEALAMIFGGRAPSGTGGSATGGGQGGALSDAAARLIAKAGAQYAAAQAALRAGDLATFARQIEALGRTLDQLEAIR